MVPCLQKYTNKLTLTIATQDPPRACKRGSHKKRGEWGGEIYATQKVLKGGGGLANSR